MYKHQAMEVVLLYVNIACAIDDEREMSPCCFDHVIGNCAAAPV